MNKPEETSFSHFTVEAISEAEKVIIKIGEVNLKRPPIKGITIDHPDAQDLDDAFWLEKTPQGDMLLQISITDVSSFIHPHLTPLLEQEAFKRSLTRYYAKAPMLPALLSEHSLSLKEEQPCPTITFSIPFDKQQNPGTLSIRLTTVKNNKRFHYEEVDQEIEQPQTAFGEMLQNAFHLAYRLLQMRRSKGALAFYNPLNGWTTTEDGRLKKISEGHKGQIIIQEFMILVNQELARLFAEKGFPAFYRNHTAKASATGRSRLLELIDGAIEHPNHNKPELIDENIRLTLEAARYSPTAEGHFALNLPAYLHITSPLRRYADLVNQRILHAILREKLSPYETTGLESMVAYSNTEENKSKREKKDYFLAEHDELIQNVVADVTQLGLLPAKDFHTIIRLAAETHDLSSPLEQEILKRLAEQQLQPNDIFTLVFRFQNTGEAWKRVMRASLQWLQGHPHIAIAIINIGKQIKKWEEEETPEEQSVGEDHNKIFSAKISLLVEGVPYSSSFCTAKQKSLAKQQASVDILTKIAGVELLQTTPDTQDITTEPIPTENRAEYAILATESLQNTTLENAVGSLNERVQQGQINPPQYTFLPSGPSHIPTFHCICKVTNPDGTFIEHSSTGSSKKEAKQKVAFLVLTSLRLNDEKWLHDFLNSDSD